MCTMCMYYVGVYVYYVYVLCRCVCTMCMYYVGVYVYYVYVLCIGVYVYYVHVLCRCVRVYEWKAGRRFIWYIRVMKDKCGSRRKP